MASEKKYQGSCHCGAVRYEVNMALDEVIACNCSMCGRKGYYLSFVPATAFTLLSGADSLTDYQFNRKVIHHLFCKVCGVSSFARGVGPGGQETVAINARCLEGVDIFALKVKQVDGKQHS